MGMTVTLDRMLHTRTIHHQLGCEVGLGDCAGSGNSGGDLSPIDMVATSLASCLMLVMSKGARAKEIDLTGAWADVAYEMEDYKIKCINVIIHCSQDPSNADRAFLEKKSHECPVYLAVKGNVRVDVVFEWRSNAAPAPQPRVHSQAAQPAPCGATTHKT